MAGGVVGLGAGAATKALTMAASTGREISSVTLYDFKLEFVLKTLVLGHGRIGQCYKCLRNCR